ncbi:MAG: hypothetical protein IH606_00245 [Burkholderiales bacterium]|nr:hypothetical protein [Burkholderiales bacterium]
MLSMVQYRVSSMLTGRERHCALRREASPPGGRAPTVFLVRINTIRTKNTVMVKTEYSAGFYTRSSIACGCAFHPQAIDDPRGRFFVRAK